MENLMKLQKTRETETVPEDPFYTDASLLSFVRWTYLLSNIALWAHVRLGDPHYIYIYFYIHVFLRRTIICIYYYILYTYIHIHMREASHVHIRIHLDWHTYNLTYHISSRCDTRVEIHNNAYACVEIWSYLLCCLHLCGMSGKLKTQKSSVTKLGSHYSKIMRNPMSHSKLHKLDGQPGNRTKQTQISNSELNQNHSKLFKKVQKQEMIINRFFESAF